MPSQKGFALIPIILIVLLVGIGGIVYLNQHSGRETEFPLRFNASSDSLISPSNSSKAKSYVVPKTNQTYSDKDLGFTFTYPLKGYTVIDDTEQAYSKRKMGDFRKNFTETWGYNPPDLIKGLVLRDDSKSSDLDSSPFTLWVFNNPNNLSPKEWYNKYWYYPFVWGEYEPRKSQWGPDQVSSVSGQSANYRIIDYQTGLPKFIYLPNQGRMFLFKIIKDSSNSDVGETILKSFKLSK